MTERDQTELELLREFYRSWKWLHQQAQTRHLKEKAAQALVDAAGAIEANRAVVGRNPLSLAVHNA